MSWIPYLIALFSFLYFQVTCLSKSHWRVSKGEIYPGSVCWSNSVSDWQASLLMWPASSLVTRPGPLLNLLLFYMGYSIFLILSLFVFFSLFFFCIYLKAQGLRLLAPKWFALTWGWENKSWGREIATSRLLHILGISSYFLFIYFVLQFHFWGPYVNGKCRSYSGPQKVRMGK